MKLGSIKQAAEYTGEHPSTIRRRVERGELAGYRLGANLRVDLDELEAWVQGNRKPVRSPVAQQTEGR